MMNNQRNQWVYKLWAPLYDGLFNSRLFRQARRKVFRLATIKAGDRVLLVGAGTGADIPIIAEQDIFITAIDLSSDMFRQAQKKYKYQNVTFIEMDAQSLEFPAESFDVVIANLILSVVPDPNRCMQEIYRVARSDGEIVIFDKFKPTGKELSWFKKLIRPLIAVLGTDIGRSFEDLISAHGSNLKIEKDERVLFNGMYRGIVLKKQG